MARGKLLQECLIRIVGANRHQLNTKALCPDRLRERGIIVIWLPIGDKADHSFPMFLGELLPR